MQAIILCGGRGERLMPMTACTPAALLKLGGKTTLERILEQLEEIRLDGICLSLGYLGKMVKDEFSGVSCGEIQLAFSDSKEEGTAAAVKYAAQKDEELLIIEANCVFDFDLGGIIDFHRAKKSYATFVTVRKQEGCGFCVDNRSRVTAIETAPADRSAGSEHTFAGVYILSAQVMRDYDLSGFGDLISDAVPRMLADGKKLCVYGETGSWKRITDPQGFISCQKSLLADPEKYISAPAVFPGVYSYTENSFPGAALIPPLYIGSNVTIEEGAVVESGSVIDDNAVIGRRSRVSGSYVGAAANISARCQLDDCVICSGARLLESVSCGEYSVCGEGSRIGESSRIADKGRVWAGKEVAADTRVSGCVSCGVAKDPFIDEEGFVNFNSCVNAPSEAVRIGMAAGTAIGGGGCAAVGHCGGSASKALCSAFMAGLSSCGIGVMYLGECTAQQTAYGVSRLSCQAGFYVSADCSGRIKLMDRGGLPLTRTMERSIEQALAAGRYRSLSYPDYTGIASMKGVTGLYTDYLAAMLPARLSGINAEIRTSSPITAAAADKVFHQRNDIDGERIIFHISADGSACSAYCDSTGYIFHERLALLGIKQAFSRQIPVAVPFVFPMAADTVAESEGGILYRYFVNSDGKSDGDARKTASRPDNFFIRDGLALACMVCGSLSRNNISLSAAMEDIPTFYSTQRYVGVDGSPAGLLEGMDGASAVAGEGAVIEERSSRAVVRPVRGGGGVMIFAESFKTEAAAALCDDIQQKLKAAADIQER